MRSFVLSCLAILFGLTGLAQSQTFQERDRDRDRDRDRPYERQERDRDRESNRGRADRGALIRSHPDMGERCLDVAYGDREPGAYLHMWECWGGGNQQFYYDRSAQELKTVAGQCLEIFGGRIGDRIGTARCDNSENQRWRVEPLRRGLYQFVGANNLCMDIGAADRRNGGKLIAFRCHDGVNQQWSIEEQR